MAAEIRCSSRGAAAMRPRCAMCPVPCPEHQAKTAVLAVPPPCATCNTPLSRGARHVRAWRVTAAPPRWQNGAISREISTRECTVMISWYQSRYYLLPAFCSMTLMFMSIFNPLFQGMHIYAHRCSMPMPIPIRTNPCACVSVWGTWGFLFWMKR